MSETITIRENTNNNENEIMTPKQREIKIIQAINSSNANDTDEMPCGDNRRLIGHLSNQSRETFDTTRNQYKNKPRKYQETTTSNDKNQETNTNTIRAKNIAEWSELFNKAREKIPKPQEKTPTRMDTKVQPAIIRTGENEMFGDNMDKAHQENNFRVYFQNINGLAAGKGTRKWEDIIQEMTTRQVSVCGFAETNTEWQAEKTKARIKAKLRKVAGQATMTTSTTNLKFKTIYKPGGTATIALKKWSGRVSETVSDPSGQGRWSGFQLRTRTNNLVIITVYRVAQKSIDQVGYKTTYAQQWVVERLKGVESPEPRSQCIKDLIKTVQEWQKKKLEVIIMIDANETIGTEENGIASLASTCNLTDIHAHYHEGINNMATYARGTKRIDFIFTSKNLVEKTTASGFLAFYDGVETDHRGSFIDFDATKLFTDKTETLYSHTQRILLSKLPKTVKKYKEELWKRLNSHNICNRSEKINKQASEHPLPENFETELNSIANTIQTAMLQAEEKCAHSPAAPYSKQLADLNLVIKYWKTIKSGMKTGKNVSVQLEAIRNTISKENKTKLTRQYTTEKHIRIALKQYDEALPNAKDMRHEHLMESAKAAAKNDNKTAEQHFRCMAHAENSRETFRILRNITKPEDRSGIRQIDTPAKDNNGNIINQEDGSAIMKTITNPREVEKAIIERNIEHFGQAQGTAFTSQDLIKIFGKDGESQTTENLLQGKLPVIEHLPDAVQRILRKIAENPCTNQIETYITSQELKNLFKKWKERTSTSPSGCHLGHWHALQAPDGDDPKAELYQDLGDKIMTIHANIMNAAISSGTPLDRWIPVDSTMLSKSKGKPRIDKLRIIHLYEADYNGFLKTVWPHRAVRHATTQRRLNYAQGGGQKGRQANHIVLQKELKYQYVRLRKHNFATMDNDAKACYDRIIMLLATIISGHFGVPKQARDLQARAIRKMKFRIRTALGISATYYEDTQETPLHGSGQGSGSSSTLWMFISSIIMDCFEDVAKGMPMTNVEQTKKITQWIDGYVDDTSIFTSIQEQKSETTDPSILAQQLQHNTQEWELLLAATGGKLELSKCFYYILCWDFDEEGTPRHMTKNELEQKGVSISIQESGKSDKTIINHLDCKTAHRTLGLQKTPIGNQDKQLEQIQEKSDQITQAIATSSVNRIQAMTAWTSIYLPAVAYPLVATYFQESDLNKIENKALMTFLPKIGYNRNTPRAVVYGPTECGGIGIKNLYVEQSVEQINAYIQHTRLDSPLGQIMSINLDWVQLIAGIANPIFEDTKILHHMEGEWFVSIREFLHSTECQIKIIKGWLPQLEREHDQCIMDVFTGETKDNADKINRCRIYLQATTLADISNPEGTHINTFAWGVNTTTTQATNPRESKHDWPRQPKPGPKSWYAWRSAIKKYVSVDGKSNKLRKPLGDWIVTPTESRQNWEWYHDVRANTLLHRTHQTIYVHQHRKGRSYHARSNATINKLTKSAKPVTVEHFSMLERTKPERRQKQPENSKTINTFSEHIAALDPWEAKMLNKSDNQQHHRLAQALSSKEKIYIVSDGGQANGYGSFGWIIEGKQEYARGNGEAEGAREIMQSFRAEAYGMLAAIRFLQQACTWNRKWPTSNKTIIVFSDNMSLIQRISWHYKRITVTPKNVIASDYDAEKAITSTIDYLKTKKIIIKVQHVKGHQDKKRKKEKLSKEAQMNIEADTEATIALEQHSHTQEYNPLPETRAMLYKQGQPVTSKEAKTLRRAYLSQDLLQHMIQREKWKSESTAEKICWIAHQRALQRMNSTDKTRLHKFIHRWLPTNKKLHDYNSDHTNQCPSCHSIETNDHVTACRNSRRTQIKTKTTANLAKILNKYHTCPQIKEIMLTGIKKIWQGKYEQVSNHEVSFTPEGNTKRALQDQNEIGWSNLYRGRIALEWQTAQQHYYNKKFKKYQDTEQWTAAIITTLWHGFLQLWESRKDDQHGRDAREKQEKERDILIRRMRAIYDNLDRFTYEDNRFFNKQIHYWEQAPNHAIAEWLEIAERIAKKYKETATQKKNMINANQPLITGFFPGNRATIQERHGDNHSRRPPRRPPEGE